MNPSTRPLILSIIVNFYGHLGVQLHPVSLRHWPSLLRAAWNLALNGLVYYTLIQLDPYTVKSYTIDFTKPLHILLAFDMLFLYPFGYTLILCFFLFYGRQIVALLSDDLFERALQPFTTYTTCIGAVFCLVGHVAFYIIHDFVIQLNSAFTLANVLCLSTLYIIYFHWFLVLFVVHYFQYATHVALREIASSLRPGRPVDHSVIERIQRLAHVNRQLNGLVSAPLAAFLLTVLIDGIASISLSRFIGTVEVYVHIVIIFTYFLYLSYLGMRIQSALHQIATYGRNHCLVNSPCAESTESSVRFHELEIYYGYFPLRIFLLCYIDFAFLLAVLLMIFNYCVLIIQTSQ